jgi:hypothetical protein
MNKISIKTTEMTLTLYCKLVRYCLNVYFEPGIKHHYNIYVGLLDHGPRMGLCGEASWSGYFHGYVSHGKSWAHISPLRQTSETTTNTLLSPAW